MVDQILNDARDHKYQAQSAICRTQTLLRMMKSYAEQNAPSASDLGPDFIYACQIASEELDRADAQIDEILKVIAMAPLENKRAA